MFISPFEDEKSKVAKKVLAVLAQGMRKVVFLPMTKRYKFSVRPTKNVKIEDFEQFSESAVLSEFLTKTEEELIMKTDLYKDVLNLKNKKLKKLHNNYKKVI